MLNTPVQQPIVQGMTVTTLNDLPGINDLVSVTLRALDSGDTESVASDVASRIEDLATDGRTGRTNSYVIAAPHFHGDLDTPLAGAEFFLQWLSPRGIWLLPITFLEQRTVATGLRVWHVAVAGEARREERRRFVRVPLDIDTCLEVTRSLAALPPRRRELAERAGVRAALPELPQEVAARTTNLSEGGLLCTSRGPVLPTHLPLMTRFSVEGRSFAVNAYVVWSTPCGDGSVESALTFEESDPQCEVLRPLLWQVQLAARRAKLA